MKLGDINSNQFTPLLPLNTLKIGLYKSQQFGSKNNALHLKQIEY